MVSAGAGEMGQFTGNFYGDRKKGKSKKAEGKNPEVTFWTADWLLSIFDIESFRVFATVVGVADFKRG
jgi:hypothetical protein